MYGWALDSHLHSPEMFSWDLAGLLELWPSCPLTSDQACAVCSLLLVPATVAPHLDFPHECGSCFLKSASCPIVRDILWKLLAGLLSLKNPLPTHHTLPVHFFPSSCLGE